VILLGFVTIANVAAGAIERRLLRWRTLSGTGPIDG
jgi:NitT/TauT family transport system permease protein